MEAMECLLSRRSVRQFAPVDVEAADIDRILRAAMAAPSAGNEQPWEFILLTDRAVLDHTATLHPHAQMVLTAPVAVVVCGDLSKEVHKGCWVQDCAAAVQNILLAAHALGLGAVWTSIYPIEARVEAFRKALHLPETIVPLALVPIGVPQDASPRAFRFDATRVHNNRW